MFEELEKYKSLDFFARQVMEGFISGLHKSPFHGFSVEFSEHRQYNSGESTRNIDWKLYGRTDKLFVKRFEEETNLRCQIVLDHSRSMLFPLERHGDHLHPNKLTFSIFASALLTEMMVRQRDAFGLTLVGQGIDFQSEVRSSKAHQHYILGLLEQELLKPTDKAVSAPSETRISDALHLTAEKLRQRSLVVVFTDAFVSQQESDALLDSLRHLRHCKHEVVLFHTMSRPLEVEFEFANKPTEFIDLETGRSLKVQPQEVVGSYQDQMHRMVSEFKKRAIQYRVDYVPIDIEAGFEPMLIPYLLKRSKLK